MPAIETIHPPPRLLLGTSLLFWGAMTDRPIIGLVLALMLEARHWTRFRWDFDDDACSRAWQFTSIAIAIAAILIWLDGNRYTALPNLLSWMPPLLLPMQFVQSYGMRDSLPMSTFSFLARRRKERNQRLGLLEKTTEFNFGNVTFVTAIVGATVGGNSGSWMFLPGVVILTGWLLLSIGRSRPLALIPVLIVSLLLAKAGQIGLQKAEEWIGRAASPNRNRFDPNFEATMIGRRGHVQQSPDIEWRLRPKPKTAAPKFLRVGTFNNFLRTNWQNQYIAITDFKDLDTRLIDDQAYYLLQDSQRETQFAQLPSFTLRGGASEESPLPLPGDTAALRDFELDGIERNTFGTVRVFPKHSVIDGTVFHGDHTNPEKPPQGAEDLRVPVAERAILSETAQTLQLDKTPDLLQKLAIIRTWFHQNFRYSLDLSISYRLDGKGGPTAITRFLGDVRTGHCEYFATAATLLLRESGIPARYATGYAVIERDPKHGEFVIRGTHGHAWCRVWDENAGVWIDFDPTPSSYLATGTHRFSRMQRFNDWLKCVREDFFIWRNRSSSRFAITGVMIAIALGLAGFVIKRLWRSKRVLATQYRSEAYSGPVIHTPLHDLESLARKRIGERSAGQTFATWLRNLQPSLPDTLLLDEAIQLHQRIRFDPQPASQDEQQRLARVCRQLASALKR